MYINIQARGRGKTTQAVEWVKQGRTDDREDSSNRILVVKSEAIKARIMHDCDLGYHEIETWHTISKSYYWPTLRNKELFLDDADLFLQYIFKGLLKGISLTKEEMINQYPENNNK